MANPYVNKVVYDNNTLIDITDTTATASDVVSGKSFYLASGQRATGTADYMDLVDNPTANDILVTDANGQAVDSGVTINDLKVLVVTSSSFSSLPLTINNAKITSHMVVINYDLSNPIAQIGKWTVTTTDGKATVAGSINGSTTLTLYLAEQRS